MAAFFTLPELRAELHSLGHDDVPDHLILAFLSQLQITIPGCFEDQGDGRTEQGKTVHQENHLEFLDEIPYGRRHGRNVRFESQGKKPEQRPRRPDTPPRGNTAYSSSDSEASKENHRCGSWNQQPNYTKRQVLQPCDNIVSDGEAAATIPSKKCHPHHRKHHDDVEEYLYPGDILAHLKEQHRPCSCPIAGDFKKDEELSVRSMSAEGCYHKVVSGETSEFSTGSSSKVTSSTEFKDDHTRREHHSQEVHTGSSLYSFDGDFPGLNLKPLNVGVVKQHKSNSNSSSQTCISEDGTFIEESSHEDSRGTSCPACVLLRESRTPKFKHFSLGNKNGDGEKCRDSSPFSVEADGDKADDQLSNSPGNSTRRNYVFDNSRRMLRRGKIDRVARFAEMQKVWSRDNFLQGRRKKQSFHKMFAEIHASNEREYAASRARSVLGIREEQELPPFVLTT